MSPTPITPGDARGLARKKYDRHAGAWAASATGRAEGGGSRADGPTAAGSGAAASGVCVAEGPLLAIPLHPPTERAALADQAGAIAWVRSWADADTGTVRWGTRRWANLGTQRVPERLVLEAPLDVARAAGRMDHWHLLSRRFGDLVRRVPGDAAALVAALPRAASAVVALDDADFTRLVGVLEWLAAHPDSGLYIRQLPIRGVDSKWVGAHRGLVRRLHAAASGNAELGLAGAPDLIRVRFLDPKLAPGGLRDVSAPVADLAALGTAPRMVFVFENLETVLAMPDTEGAVVVHGSGYAVDRLGALPWVRDTAVVYWGDLDSHGFAILNRLRSHGVGARSVLMDPATLDAFADLCVPEPTPSTARPEYLTSAELETVQLLAERGNVRLEQERIDWAHALEALRGAADN